MLDNKSYPMIFKRKSFHLFRNLGEEKIEACELRKIEEAFGSFDRLYPNIRTAIRIVPAEQVGFKRGAEYCILMYSENRENYLMNLGYVGQQLDLYLVSKDIGTLWYGIGKGDEPQYEGLDFAIMIAIHKVSDQSKYRKDMFKAKRKPLEEVWEGESFGVGEIARFAPSACNTQPWFVKNIGNGIEVYRYKKPGKRGIMPTDSVSYYNRIDIGIYLCILEICMAQEGIKATRQLFIDDEDKEYALVAKYTLD